MGSILVLVLFLGACYGVAALGGIATASSVGTWYQTIRKPEWTPSGQVIGTVWTFLYGMMAISAWLAWRQTGWCGSMGQAWVQPWLIAFGIQLALNLAWSWLFFGLRSPGLAMIDIVLLWAAILVTLWLIWPLSRVGGILLLPYLAWVSFAGVLNFVIWWMNRG
ncbi:MAG: tryptophan-rich sensory protein [Phycisphaeraceae bacterium]|nr:tryptophan-rich sensory protein [Phycisphaeraceae bacterium]